MSPVCFLRLKHRLVSCVLTSGPGAIEHQKYAQLLTINTVAPCITQPDGANIHALPTDRSHDMSLRVPTAYSPGTAVVTICFFYGGGLKYQGTFIRTTASAGVPQLSFGTLQKLNIADSPMMVIVPLSVCCRRRYYYGGP